MSEVDANGQPSVDFYYGRERDYVIACMAQEWPRKLADQEDMGLEFSRSVGTSAGKDALGWFLRQPSTVELLMARPGGIPTYSSPQVRQTLLLSLCEYTSTYGDEDGDLLRFAVTSAMNDPDMLVRIEAVKLVVLSSDKPDDLASVLATGSTLHDFIEIVLTIGEEFPIRADEAGQVVLDALRSLHWDSGNSDDDTSEITDILVDLSEHPLANIRREANTCLGYVAPFAFVKNLSEKIERKSIHIRQGNVGEFSEAIKIAGHGLSDGYYGDLCPGALEGILEDPDYQAAEYSKMRRSLDPIICVFGGIRGTDTFKHILEDLGRGLEESEDVAGNSPHLDTHTLPLPFGDEGN